MSDLIDREQLLNSMFADDPKDFFVYIADFPYVDAVEVVRCADCKHTVSFTSGGFNYRFCVVNDRDVDDNDFCSYGEKGEGE